MHPSWTRNWGSLKSNLSCGCCILGTTFEKLHLSKYGPFKSKQSSTRPAFWTASLHLHPFKRNVSQTSAAAFHLMAFSPTLTPPHCTSSLHPPAPSFLHVNLGRQVYILIFKAALFSVKCCVATSNARPDRAFPGFQRGGRIIGGRPQRIWQMYDEFLLGPVFLSLLPFFLSFPSFFFESFMCVCARERGKNTRPLFVVVLPLPSPLPP